MATNKPKPPAAPTSSKSKAEEAKAAKAAEDAKAAKEWKDKADKEANAKAAKEAADKKANDKAVEDAKKAEDAKAAKAAKDAAKAVEDAKKAVQPVEDTAKKAEVPNEVAATMEKDAPEGQEDATPAGEENVQENAAPPAASEEGPGVALTATLPTEEEEDARYVVKGKIKRSRADRSIFQLIKERRKIRFDHAIQRNNVWSDTQKSLLVHSILDNYPIPIIYMHDTHDDLLWMIDGKQRVSGAIFEFYDNKLAIDKGTPPVLVENEDGTIEYVEIEGKFFNQLPINLQQDFLGYDMAIVEIKNITPDQVEELFLRLNGGTPLTKIELTRAKAGERTMAFVEKAHDTVLFGKYSAISVGQRNRFVDQEMILQTLLIMMGRETGISTPEVEEFVVALKVTGIPEEVEKKFFAVSEYMGQAFAQFDDKFRNKSLKKTHVPMLFMRAIEALETGIPAKAFGLWAYSFFMTRYKGSEYSSYCSSAVARKNKKDMRLKLLKEEYDANIQDAIKVAENTPDKHEGKDLVIKDPGQYEFDQDGNIITGDGEIVG
ncbi:DUF262 domain-containing protein [Paenibacillus sp. FSL R7-0302]|uniref:GmrSD restriction endonuclease domain-containing protein n=1 Tax=Paenibacillus sp. FSL R7-0302 TaxID=2921681 RepID=UPI0030F830D0